MSSKWKLVDIETGKAVNIGDRLTTYRGEEVWIAAMLPPHKSESFGKVLVDQEANHRCDNILYASFVGCRYVAR